MKERCFGRLILFFVVVLNFANISSQNTYYVAVDGNPSGKGTIDDPLDVWSAFDGYNQLTPMTPGDTLYFREGVYEGVNFGIGFSGTKDKPCIVKPYNHETVVFRGIIEVGTGMAVFRNNGHYVHVYDMIITCAAQDRITNVAGSYPDIPNATGGYITGPGGKFINCIFHNNSKTGINSTSTAVDAEIYGNIVFDNGWVEISNGGTRRYGHGHSLYFQNADGRKNIENNIMFNTYGYGIQFYSEGGTGTSGSDVMNNTVFNSGSLGNSKDYAQGGYNYLLDTNEGTILDGNIAYHNDAGSNFMVGYNSVGQYVSLYNNYSLGGNTGIYYKNFYSVTSQYNTVVMPNNKSTGYNYNLGTIYYPNNSYYPDENMNYDINNNSYYTDDAGYSYTGDFEDWQRIHGADLNGSFSYVTSFKEVPNEIRVYANKYEAKRAHIFIANNQLLNTVSVPIPDSILKVGDEYWLYDVEDMRKPIRQETYDGNPLQIPTNQTSTFPVIGTEVYKQAIHSGEEFGSFLLIGRELNIPGPETIKIDSLTSKSWIEEDKVYEDIGAYYTLEEDAEVSLTILNNSLSPVLTISDYQGGSLVDMPDTCKTGSYVLKVNTNSAVDEKGFSFNPLTLFTSDTTICNELWLSYYSPVNDSIKLNIHESSGNLLLDSLIYSAKGLDSLYVDLSGFTDGSYSAKLTYSKRETSEILIEKNSCDSLNIISCEPESTYRFTTISYVSPNTDSVSVNLKNAQGISVLDSVLIGPKGEQLYRDINLWGLNPGTYQLVLDDHISESVWPDSIVKLRPLEILSYEDSIYNVCTLEYYSPLSESVLIKIMTLNGAVVDSLTDTSVFGVNKVDVDLTGFDAAKYIIKLIDNISSDSCVVTKLAELNILDYINNVTDTLSINYFSPRETNVTLDVLYSSGGAVIEPVTQGAVIGNNAIEIDLATIKEGDYSFILFDGITSLERSFTKLAAEVPYEFEISNYTGSVIDTLTVEYYTSRDTIIQLQVYNGGDLVATEDHHSVAGSNMLEIDLATLTEGDYTFILFDGITSLERSFTKLAAEVPYEFEISNYTSNVIDTLTIEYLTSRDTIIVLAVYYGSQIVVSSSQQSEVGRNLIKVDFESFAEGSYTFVLSDGITELQRDFYKQGESIPGGQLEISGFTEEVSDNLVVDYVSPGNNKVVLDVINSSGEIMVESIEQDAITGSNTIKADLTDLEAGSYKFVLSDGITTLEEEFKKIDSETSCEFKLISLGPKETVDRISVTFLASQDGNIEIDIYHIDGNPDFEVLIRQIISVKECEKRTVIINLEGRLDSSNSYFLKLREVNTGKEQKDTFSIE